MISLELLIAANIHHYYLLSS